MNLLSRVKSLGITVKQTSSTGAKAKELFMSGNYTGHKRNVQNIQQTELAMLHRTIKADVWRG